METNSDDLIAYLSLLQPDRTDEHAFCWFVQNHETSQVRQFYGTPEAALEALIGYNQRGFGVFVCVNAIDEPVYVGDKPKRRREDVTRVRAVFGDFDDPAKPLPVFDLPPSMLVETSPGKHHAYWLVDDMPLADFEPRQQGIINRYAASGSDRSIRDLSRVMRVPGFMHVKDRASPKPVRLIEASGTRYSADALAAAFPHAAIQRKFDAPPWDGSVSLTAEITQAYVDAVYGIKDGRALVDCPNAHHHTTQGGNATCYWAPTGDNSGRGGFKCQHAHCQTLRINDFDLYVEQQIRAQLASQKGAP